MKSFLENINFETEIDIVLIGKIDIILIGKINKGMSLGKLNKNNF